VPLLPDSSSPAALPRQRWCPPHRRRPVVVPSQSSCCHPVAGPLCFACDAIFNVSDGLPVELGGAGSSFPPSADAPLHTRCHPAFGVGLPLGTWCSCQPLPFLVHTTSSSSYGIITPLLSLHRACRLGWALLLRLRPAPSSFRRSALQCGCWQGRLL
jgi:hypothetical protein